MTLAKHCDAPDCDSWQREGATPDTWLTLTAATLTKHFCCPWCALRHLSTLAEPTENVEVPR